MRSTATDDGSSSGGWCIIIYVIWHSRAALGFLSQPPLSSRSGLSHGATRWLVPCAKKGFGKSTKASKRRRYPPSENSLVEAPPLSDKGEAPLQTGRSSRGGSEKKSQDQIFAKYGMQSADEDAKQIQRQDPSRPPTRLIKIVPPSVQLGLERFLIGAIVVLLLAFVGIGLGICLEAFAVASNQPLPDDRRQFIVNFLEPAFTPTLVAGFACSITLGLLKTLQLSSDDVQYSEYAGRD